MISPEKLNKEARSSLLAKKIEKNSAKNNFHKLNIAIRQPTVRKIAPSLQRKRTTFGFLSSGHTVNQYSYFWSQRFLRCGLPSRYAGNKRAAMTHNIWGNMYSSAAEGYGKSIDDCDPSLE